VGKPITQWLEYSVDNGEVGSSNLPGLKIFMLFVVRHVRHSQMVRQQFLILSIVGSSPSVSEK
jgi:hypothetical protein